MARSSDRVAASDWRNAFLRQAQSDFLTFEKQLRDAPACHRLHFLQMASEKLAKAILARPGQRPPAKHNAFAGMIKAMPQAVARAIGLETNSQIISLRKELLPCARELEELAPSGGVDKPNAEYPWQGPRGVVSPLDYNFRLLSPNNAPMKKLIKLIDRCLKDFSRGAES